MLITPEKIQPHYLFRSSTTWIRHTHTRESNLLYLNSSINHIQSIFIKIHTTIFDKNIWTHTNTQGAHTRTSYHVFSYFFVVYIIELCENLSTHNPLTLILLQSLHFVPPHFVSILQMSSRHVLRNRIAWL